MSETVTFKIEKDVPIPTGRGSNPLYDFIQGMKPGDSVRITKEHESPVRSRMGKMNKLNDGRLFIWRSAAKKAGKPDGGRIWCIKDTEGAAFAGSRSPSKSKTKTGGKPSK